jgi:oligoribonuclease NrnB/cAMP/cGMP phosphodiesterase (DHH superfamily)
MLYFGREMESLLKPDVILTHESDLDGFVSGVLLQRLAKKVFGADVPLEAYHYNAWKQRDMRERCAWVCDFTFDQRTDKPNWLVIDHHKTETFPKTAQLIHDLNKSAGLLCYELCQKHGISSPELDQLVRYNNVADLFLEDDPDFVIANDYANLVKTYGFWNLHSLINGDIEKLLGHPLLEVMAVKRKVEDPLGYEWSVKSVQEITPKVGYVETVVGNVNLIVHQLLEKQATPYPILLTMIKKSNNVIVVSLRSKNGEALKIAEKLQGGGHANACGATLPRSVKSIPDAINYIRQALDSQVRPGTSLNSLESLFDAIENPR